MQIILGAQGEDVEARPLPQRGGQLRQIAVRLPCTPANAQFMPVYHRHRTGSDPRQGGAYL